MLDVLEQKICLITLLLIFTFQSGLAVSVRNGDQTVFEGGTHAQVINYWFDVVYLYNFAYEKFLFGSSRAKENITEIYFQESNCTRDDENNMNKTKACTFNPKGKIIICHMPVEFTNCKFTGDKYDIPKTDRRSEDYAILAVEAYNEKNYKPTNPLRLSNHVNVMSTLKREVSIGTKNVLQFSTEEENCTKSRLANGMVNSKCFTVKPRFDCEATVNEPITTMNDSELRYFEKLTSPVLEFKRNVDVKCQENKSPDDVIAMRKMPPPEKTTCSEIHYNPTKTSTGFSVHCLKRGRLHKPSVSVRYDTEDETSNELAILGRRQAEFINSKFDEVYFYKFAFGKYLYGSSPAKEEILENYFQETNCKKGDMKNINKTKACDFNPKGKIMICHIKRKAMLVNVTNCKSTGDKYDIPKTDRRSENYAVVAVKGYNKKNYTPESPLRLSLAVNVMSAVTREVSLSIKNVLQFSTAELNCTNSRNATGKEKCFPVKPRLDCEATVNEPLYTDTRFGTIVHLQNVDVKCQENKSPDDVTAMRNMPPPEKHACSYKIYNPTKGFPNRHFRDCRSDDEPEKTAGSSMEDQKLVKPKAGSAVVESSADKEGNNKTAETMSSGSVPKKASTSKVKAKSNLTKAKPKTTAMKMREVESKRADQPEEDGAYASSDEGQPPITPIIPKKLIKKEKAVTKAPGRQNTTKTKNKEKALEHSIEEGDSEEAKFEKKKQIGKASARQEKANDGGQIVSGGKKKVKVPPQPEHFLAGKEDKKSNSKPKKGSIGSAGKQKSAAAKERGKNQKTKEEKEKNEDEKKHPDDEDKIIKASEPKLKTKPGKKGSAASNKKGEKAKKDKSALEEEAKTNEKETDEAKNNNGKKENK